MSWRRAHRSSPLRGVRESPSLWAISGWIDAATGDPDRALDQLDSVELRDFLDRLGRDFLWLPAMIGCAVAASYGRPSWAGPVHETLAGYGGSLGVTGFAIFFGAIDHHLGTLALILEPPGEATERLEHAVQVHRALGAAPFVGLSEHWLARGSGGPRGSAGRPWAEALRADRDALVEEFGLRGLTRVPMMRIGRRRRGDAGGVGDHACGRRRDPSHRSSGAPP